MNKRVLLKNLDKAAEWVVAKQRDHDQSVNIMVGCFGVLRQAGQRDMAGWLDRKPERRRVLSDVRESYLSKRGNKVLRDLVTLTISAVEACTWVDNWLPGAMPVPLASGRKPTKSQLAALTQGGRNQRETLKKLRLLRDRYHSTSLPSAAKKSAVFPGV